MTSIMMSYSRIIENHVTPCPQQDGAETSLEICRECARNRGFVGDPEFKWVRCQPL